MEIIPPSPRNPNFVTRVLVRLAGADTETLMLCPQRDWANVLAVAEIAIFAWIYLTCLFSGIAHLLFAGRRPFHPEFVAAGMFIAGFILLIDSYMVLRSGWHLAGIAELKRGGIDISGGPGARLKMGVFLAFRILLSVGIAQLTAIFVALIVFSPDIDERIRSNLIAANAPTIVAATERIDAEISRARDAAMSEAKRVTSLAAQLDALRQQAVTTELPTNPEISSAETELASLVERKNKADDEVQTAQNFATNELAGIKDAAGTSGQIGEGIRYRAAKQRVANAVKRANELRAAVQAARKHIDALRAQVATASAATLQQVHDQIPTLDGSLNAERDREKALNENLATLVKNRDRAVQNTIKNSPAYLTASRGFLTQIAALKQISNADPEIGIIILLIDLVSFSLELAAVLTKITSFVPTAYAALLARDAYLQAVRIADEMEGQLNRSKVDAEPLALPAPANDKLEQAEPDEPLPPDPPQPDPPPEPPQPEPSPPTPDDDPPVRPHPEGGPQLPAANDNTPPPAKRQRGRPRKTPVP